MYVQECTCSSEHLHQLALKNLTCFARFASPAVTPQCPRLFSALLPWRSSDHMSLDMGPWISSFTVSSLMVGVSSSKQQRSRAVLDSISMQTPRNHGERAQKPRPTCPPPVRCKPACLLLCGGCLSPLRMFVSVCVCEAVCVCLSRNGSHHGYSPIRRRWPYKALHKSQVIGG